MSKSFIDKLAEKRVMKLWKKNGGDLAGAELAMMELMHKRREAYGLEAAND